MVLRNRIVEESTKLFFQKGIKSITMSDIASHLGISKRTLYEVFCDKEELLRECLECSIVKADEESQLLINESKDAIDAMMRIYAKNLNDSQKMNRSVVHDLRKYHPRLYKIIEEKQKEEAFAFIPLFKKGEEEGLMRSDVNFEIVIWLLKAQFKMLIEGDFIPTEKYSIEQFVSAIILTFTRGIATQKGNEKIDEYIAKYNNKEEIK